MKGRDLDIRLMSMRRLSQCWSMWKKVWICSDVKTLVPMADSNATTSGAWPVSSLTSSCAQKNFLNVFVSTPVSFVEKTERCLGLWTTSQRVNTRTDCCTETCGNAESRSDEQGRISVCGKVFGEQIVKCGLKNFCRS